MTTVAIVVHERDPIESRPYIVNLLVPHWRAAGWNVVVVRGPRDFKAADIAINHVDLTRVPAGYRRLLARYPKVVNGGAHDIAKRRYSRLRVRCGGRYDGPVIVKTDRNHGGVPEALIRAARPDLWSRLLTRLGALAQRRLPWTITGYLGHNRYPRFERRRDVPWHVWANPRLIVERFAMPERDGTFEKRRWLFFGAHEATFRFTTSTYVPGDDTILASEDAPPAPEPVREARRLLGLDYGSADFAIFDGAPVVFDLNRTPASQAYAKQSYTAALRDLAEGLLDAVR